MNNNELLSLIEALGKHARFIGKADNRVISTIESELEVILPKSYKLFLRDFGIAVLPGFIILGNGLSPLPACVQATQDWRNYGLSRDLVVIEDSGTDWIYCLKTSSLVNEECPVVNWSQNAGIGQIYFETFLAFFEARLGITPSNRQRRERRVKTTGPSRLLLGTIFTLDGSGLKSRHQIWAL